MCTVTIEYSKNKKEMDMLLSVMKKLGAVVTIITDDEQNYNPEIVKKVEQGRNDHKNGKCVKLGIDDLWK